MKKKIIEIKLEDKGQDFLELDVLENGVLLGYSIIFSKNRISLLGIGTLNGSEYMPFSELKKGNFPKEKNLYVYIKDTGKKDPLPWEASTLNYKVVKILNLKNKNEK